MFGWQKFSRRLHYGIRHSLLSSLFGLLVGVALVSIFFFRQPLIIGTSVVFSFPGFEHGTYPDGSKFQPDDLRRGEIVRESLKKLGLDQSDAFLKKTENRFSIEGVVTLQVIQSRDRLREAGQNPPLFVPDEYTLSFTNDSNSGLTKKESEVLVQEIVATYRDNFRQTYGEMPAAFGHALQRLETSDFTEYELILNAEVKAISAYLEERAKQAPSFRSPTTRLSFQDLLEQTRFFSEIQLNETLGLIHEYGLSQDRNVALIKMNNQLRLLSNREHLALDEDNLIKSLLAQTQSQAQNYLVGIKSQVIQARNEAPIIDQTLVNSLLTNDAYNFLVRRALKVGLAVKDLEAEKSKLTDLIVNMQSFVKSAPIDQSAIVGEAKKSLSSLGITYQKLIDDIGKTYEDYATQEFGNAIRISAPVRSKSLFRPIVEAALVGGLLGFAWGIGISLLRKSS